ncbi:MAG: AI-2E family transporter [Candidatus Rokuibacteriota bacterium]
MAELLERPRLQSLVGLVAAALLVFGAYVILAPFLVPIAWAAILAYTTWPLYRRVRSVLGGRDFWAALTMTCLVILAVAVPVTGLSLALADDVVEVFRTLRAWATDPPDLPAWASELPVIGSSLVTWHAALRTNPGALRGLLADQAPRWSQAVLSAAGDVGRNLGRLGLTLLTIFFLYRHGERVMAQTDRVLDRLAGERVQRRLAIVGATVRAVCYGVLLTAVAQGVLAGLGFWAAGVKASVLLGALTALLALLPFGPPLVWLPVGLWLLATGEGLVRGIAVLLWGALAVSGVDNIIRPYFIGGATQVPFLFVLFGVLGGLAAFGLLGLFIGPVILAILLVLWREWAAESFAEGGPAT